MKIYASPTDNQIKSAAEIIKVGGLVAFPTETVYGLGADGLSEEAVRKIYAAKGRPADNPLILHISDFTQINAIAREIPDDFYKIKHLMPGPLTVVLKKSAAVPDCITAGLDTVAIRMPANDIASKLIKYSNTPIAAPSANLSGKPSSTTLQHVADDYKNSPHIDCILGGETCRVGVESTILDLSKLTPRILRVGAITKEEIEESLNKGINLYTSTNDTPEAPGMKYLHYAPRAPLYIDEKIQENIKKIDDKIIGILVFNKKIEDNIKIITKNRKNNQNIQYEILLGDTPEQWAHNLYAALRKCDELGVDIIFAPPIVGDGLAAAVRNRLYKAAKNGDDYI